MAFDDVLAHTRTVRADAVVRAAAVHGVALDPDRVADRVTGHALAEIVHAMTADDPAVRSDPTLIDLITLEAARITTRTAPYGGAHGVRIDATARARCTQDVALGRRVMLRVDSTRRDAETLLQIATLDELPIVTICADDRLDGVPSATVAERAWKTIDRRLTALGIPLAERVAIESTPALASIARAFVGTCEVWAPSQ